jgi:hypothetical protein
MVGACGPRSPSDQGGVFSGSGDSDNSPSDPEDPFVADDPSCPDAAAVVSASSGWESVTALQPAYDTLELSLMARPKAAGINALVVAGGRQIGDFSDAAILVRFADDQRVREQVNPALRKRPHALLRRCWGGGRLTLRSPHGDRPREVGASARRAV